MSYHIFPLLHFDTDLYLTQLQTLMMRYTNVRLLQLLLFVW